jgi:hypothetical protein
MQACPLLQPHFPAIILLVATLQFWIEVNLKFLDEVKSSYGDSEL